MCLDHLHSQDLHIPKLDASRKEFCTGVVVTASDTATSKPDDGRFTGIKLVGRIIESKTEPMMNLPGLSQVFIAAAQAHQPPLEDHVNYGYDRLGARVELNTTSVSASPK